MKNESYRFVAEPEGLDKECKTVSADLLCHEVSWKKERAQFLIDQKGGPVEPRKSHFYGGIIALTVYLIGALCYFGFRIFPATLNNFGIAVAILVAMIYAVYESSYKYIHFAKAKNRYESERARLEKNLSALQSRRMGLPEDRRQQ